MVLEPISVEPIQSHKAETAVLEPGTEYVYSVGDGAKNVTSVESPASFKTPEVILIHLTLTGLLTYTHQKTLITMAKLSTKHLRISRMLHLY